MLGSYLASLCQTSAFQQRKEPVLFEWVDLLPDFTTFNVTTSLKDWILICGNLTINLTKRSKRTNLTESLND